MRLLTRLVCCLVEASTCVDQLITAFSPLEDGERWSWRIQLLRFATSLYQSTIQQEIREPNTPFMQSTSDVQHIHVYPVSSYSLCLSQYISHLMYIDEWIIMFKHFNFGYFLEKQYARPFGMGTNLRYKFLLPDLNICEIVEQILIETGANMLNNHPPSPSPPLNLKSCFTWRQREKENSFQKYFHCWGCLNGGRGNWIRIINASLLGFLCEGILISGSDKLPLRSCGRDFSPLFSRETQLVWISMITGPFCPPWIMGKGILELLWRLRRHPAKVHWSISTPSSLYLLPFLARSYWTTLKVPIFLE